MPYKDFFYLANWISVSRIFLIYPFFINFWQQNYVKALIYLLLMCITDILDGFVARVLKQVSTIGKGIDPLADKICAIFVLHAILDKATIPMFPFYFMIARDFLLIYLGAVAINWRQPITGSDFFGKAMTFLLAISAIFFLLFLMKGIIFFYDVGLYLYYISFLFLLVTFYTYGRVSYIIINTHYKSK